MPPIRGWFKARKPLQASRKKYYEDIYGEKNPEEDLEGVHIIDTESESDPEFFSRRRRRQGRKGTSITLRNKNRGRADRDEEMETAEGSEIVVPTLNSRTAEVTIDDDSDVDDLFVADLRKHAQSPLNSNTENAVELPGANAQHGMNPEFLAEVKKYAAQPLLINNKSNDELLRKINGRAESFANQSPLAPKESFEQESDATTVLPSIEELSDEAPVEMLDDATSSGAVDGEAVKSTSRPSIAARREHSWDPSQGSDYVYSDEEVEDDVPDTNRQEVNVRSDMHQDDHDKDEESQMDNDTTGGAEDDDTRDVVRPISGRQRETNKGTAETVSTHIDSSVDFEDDDDDDIQEVVDLTLPTRASSEESAIRGRLSRPSRLDFEDHHSTTSPEPVTLIRTRKRRFGVFASSPRPSIEPELGDLSDDTRPRKLHDLVQRRRGKEKREVATKRARYNLRPRQQQKGYNQTSLIGYIADKRASETDSETEEMQTSLRVTRSMTAKRQSVKKPILRFKAARKTAWAAMGVIPKDDINRSRSSRQVVEVVIPKVVDRSTWSSTSSPQEERKQLPAMHEELFTHDNKRKLALALSGRGVKRMTEHNDNEDEEEATNNKSSVSRNGRQVLEVVLID